MTAAQIAVRRTWRFRQCVVLQQYSWDMDSCTRVKTVDRGAPLVVALESTDDCVAFVHTGLLYELHHIKGLGAQSSLSLLEEVSDHRPRMWPSAPRWSGRQRQRYTLRSKQPTTVPLASRAPKQAS